MEKEPNWNQLWEDRVSNVTYVGVMLTKCQNCGDQDRNWCDCAKDNWIYEEKERWLAKINMPK